MREEWVGGFGVLGVLLMVRKREGGGAGEGRSRVE